MSDVGVLIGPTASGKSALAVALAAAVGDVEIVSMDSMAVYRGMDIGTATPSMADRGGVPHHLLDVVDPWCEHTVADHQAMVNEVLADISGRGHRALLVGGTGLYVRAVVDRLSIPARYPEVRAALEADPDTEALHRRLSELDPLAASRMEPMNRRRILRALEVTLGSGMPFSAHGPGLGEHAPVSWPIIGLELERPLVDRRIAERYAIQMEVGFLDEVRTLAALPEGLSPTARQALGYRELLSHIEQGVPLETAVTEAITRTRRFARRQQRWFRRDPRIQWISVDEAGTSGLVSTVATALGW